MGKTKFDGHGRLFEPMDEDSNANVISMAQSISEEPYWIGIRSQPHQFESHENFYYVSKGPLGPTLPKELWADGNPNGNIIFENCVSVLSRPSSGLKWNHINCDEKNLVICELNEEESCGKPEHANDKFCDDENNNAGCNWDSGACCNHLARANPILGYTEWNAYCKECKCLDPNFRPPTCKT